MPQELEFNDLKNKKKFKTTEWRLEVRGHRRFVVAKVPGEDYESWRIVGKDFKVEG